VTGPVGRAPVAHAQLVPPRDAHGKATRAERRAVLAMTAVHRALEFLGFAVVDVDAEHDAQGLQREEDLRISDGDYLAVVDATAAPGNAKQKMFEDLRAYMERRRADPRFADAVVRGMLVVNQHRHDPPMLRLQLYETDQRWVTEANARGVSLVPTWELFRLIRGVTVGDISKDDARAALQQPGLFKSPVG